jgi:hypothetical protein
MNYKTVISVPPNTGIYEPTELTFKLTQGTIIGGGVFLPWGCAGLVGIRLLRHNTQLYPLSPSEWYVGNDIQYSFEDNYELSTEPYELIIQGYNWDDTYNHSPIVWIDILRPQDTKGIQQFLKALGIR